MQREIGSAYWLCFIAQYQPVCMHAFHLKGAAVVSASHQYCVVKEHNVTFSPQ